MDASDVIRVLGLERHPEGGWYAETWRDAAPAGERPASSAIYYLLPRGETSRWHRIDASETWHFYAGAPLRLLVNVEGVSVIEHHLGPDLEAGERPQVTIPPAAWQSAESEGAWTLVGCTVAPAFSGEELAPEDWSPGLVPPGEATPAG